MHLSLKFIFIYLLFRTISTFSTWAKVGGKRIYSPFEPWVSSASAPAPCPVAHRHPSDRPHWPGLGVMHARVLPAETAPLEDCWVWCSFSYPIRRNSYFFWVFFCYFLCKSSSSSRVSLASFLQPRDSAQRDSYHCPCDATSMAQCSYLLGSWCGTVCCWAHCGQHQ